MPDPDFILLGDAIWIDFVNTTRGTGPSTDRLNDVAAYHRWIKAQKLSSDADQQPFDEVLAFRDRLTALAEALSRGKQAPTSSIHAVNAVLVRTTGHNQLTRVGGEWRTKFVPLKPAAAIDAIARSVAGTLSDPAAVVRQCSGPDCTLFFVDTNPNHVRRWCRMAVCGVKLRIERRRNPR